MRLLAATAAALCAAAVLLLGGIGRGDSAQASPLDGQAAALRGYEALEAARVNVDPSRYATAEREFHAALESGGADALAIRGLAALAAARHRFDESLALAERARRLNPRHPAVYGLIGDASLELGRYPAAFAAFDRMTALKPGATSYARVSYARELLGDTAGAIAAMRMAVDATGRGEPRSWALVHLANLYGGRGDTAVAAGLYREALANTPRYAPAVAGLADLAAGAGRWARAERLYRLAFAAVEDPGVAASLGDVLAARGRKAEAEAWFRRALRLERDFARFGGRNQVETAEFDLNHDRNLRSALARARVGARLRPGSEGTHILAWALYKNGRCAEAHRVSKRALALAPTDVDAVYHRALIERCLGNDGVARRLVARVRSLDPAYMRRAPSAYRLPRIGTWESNATTLHD